MLLPLSSFPLALNDQKSFTELVRPCLGPWGMCTSRLPKYIWEAKTKKHPGILRTVGGPIELQRQKTLTETMSMAPLQGRGIS